MPQIFKPSANTVARASLFLLVTSPLILGYAIAAFSRSPANTKVDVPLNQPVPFSHQHHVLELGIDCRYCHTTVEKSAFAGVPPTETCMSCHSQIWTNSPMLEPIRQSYETGQPIVWNRVNKVPEFVYFNHSIHISRGINCNTCHGPVQNMHITWKGNAFQMSWCLECHRAPERFMYKDPANPERSPRQGVFDLYEKLMAGAPLTPRETQIASGKDPGSDNAEDKAGGAERIKELGVRVQQLADCNICHR